MPIARRFTITGRVQGVFFRASTRQIAQSLGVNGHAVNLANGDVEVLAYGEPADVDKLESWLHEGPPSASVSHVHSEEAEWEPVSGFRTG